MHREKEGLYNAFYEYYKKNVFEVRQYSTV